MATPTPAPRDHRISLNGLDFHYCEWGAPTARPVLLLHGITGHARTWDHLAAALADDHRVLALDQRGHGDSQWAPDGDYGAGTMAADVAGLVKHLGLDRFVLIGLSMGGRVAMAYADEHAARLERLIIVDIGPDLAPAGMQRIRGTIGGAPETFASVDEALAYVRQVNPLYSEALLRQRVEHGLKRLPDGRLGWKYDKALREMMRAGTRREVMDLWAPLRKIACPTLLVRGGESDLFSPEIAKRMLDLLPDGRLVEIPGAGHSVPGDQPDAFAAAARAFLTAAR